MQVYETAVGLQVAPFKHGDELHAVESVHSGPVNPTILFYV